MNRVPNWGWNLFAVFCAALIPVVAMAENSDAIAIPILRLSVAVLGCAAVAAGSRGHFLHAAWNAGKHFKKNLHRILSWAIPLAILGSILIFFLLYFQQIQRFQLKAYVRSSLGENGIALLQYAQDYDDRLPANITQQTVGDYLKPYNSKLLLIDPLSKKPFIWRHSLSGININKVKHPEKVIVAYSLPCDNEGHDGEYRLILFLDGHPLIRNDKQFWELMNEQRKLLHEK